MQNTTLTLEQIVRKNKQADLTVATIGIIILLIAMSLLVSVFAELIYSGFPRLFDADFYTNFPSRHPERAGILSAWVGTSLVMLVTACIAIPFGVAAG
ncbi:phosphate ABC transporter, permease protein PstA, partial [Vibrio parahaemolyticus]